MTNSPPSLFFLNPLIFLGVQSIINLAESKTEKKKNVNSQNQSSSNQQRLSEHFSLDILIHLSMKNLNKTVSHHLITVNSLDFKSLMQVQFTKIHLYNIQHCPFHNAHHYQQLFKKVCKLLADMAGNVNRFLIHTTISTYRRFITTLSRYAAVLCSKMQPFT